MPAETDEPDEAELVIPPHQPVGLSSDTLKFCRGLVNNVTLNAGAPDFVPMTQIVVTALQELDAAIARTA